MLSAVSSAFPIYWYIIMIKESHDIDAISIISWIGYMIACIELSLMLLATIAAIVNYRKDQQVEYEAAKF